MSVDLSTINAPTITTATLGSLSHANTIPLTTFLEIFTTIGLDGEEKTSTFREIIYDSSIYASLTASLASASKVSLSHSTKSSKTVSPSKISSPSSHSSNSTAPSMAAKAGIGIAAALLVLCLTAFLLLHVRRRRRNASSYLTRELSQRRFEKTELDTTELPRTHGRVELEGSTMEPAIPKAATVAELEVFETVDGKQDVPAISELRGRGRRRLSIRELPGSEVINEGRNALVVREVRKAELEGQEKSKEAPAPDRETNVEGFSKWAVM